MTAIEVIETNRAAYKRMFRRQVVYTKMFGVLRDVLMIAAVIWCYTAREELARIISRAFYTFVT